MRSTMAGGAPATTSGTFVFTCAASAREPIVAANETASMVTWRSDTGNSLTAMHLDAAEGYTKWNQT